ncbi:hypothetical protein ACE0DR_23730 [Azotobacter sp. CWF10]
MDGHAGRGDAGGLQVHAFEERNDKTQDNGRVSTTGLFPYRFHRKPPFAGFGQAAPARAMPELGKIEDYCVNRRYREAKSPGYRLGIEVGANAARSRAVPGGREAGGGARQAPGKQSQLRHGRFLSYRLLSGSLIS